MDRLPRSAAEVWRIWDAAESRLSAPLSERMLELAALKPGMDVLDLATGRGEPALRAARQVGPSGRVVGVEPSAPVLAMAQEAGADLPNLELRCGRAEDVADEAAFDVATVRWGLEYLTDPAAALAAVRRALRPGGRLVAAVWTAPEQASFYTLPRRIVARFRPVEEPVSPGTFALADPARLDGLLADAGLTVVHAERFAVEVLAAEDEDGLLAWVRALGPNRLLHGLPEATQRAWDAAFLAEVAPLWRDGRIALGGVTRLVVAQRDG
jgi:SAM-dependent methyltransferase